jgi:hypothetical protein
MIASPEESTCRMILPSDGVPEEASDDQFTPVQSIPLEPTKTIARLTMGEIFAVLWGMAGAAFTAGIDVEVDPMPIHEPTGVHLWCADHKKLCAWLAREKGRHFVSVALEQMMVEEKMEAAHFLLNSLADGLPMAPVISVGPKRFIHWCFREVV